MRSGEGFVQLEQLRQARRVLQRFCFGVSSSSSFSSSGGWGGRPFESTFHPTVVVIVVVVVVDLVVCLGFSRGQ